MKISVILAVFNEDKYLKKCLQTLDKQKQVDYEVVVVDDGSSKHLSASSFQLSNKKKIRFFRIEHGGTAVARNFGAKKTKGEILVFVDGDMEFSDTFLKDLCQPIIKKQAKGTFSTEEFVANWDSVWARCWNFENGLKNKRRINIERSDMKSDFRAILKSEFDKVKGFDDIGYTDTWTLVKKLNYYPEATKAKYWHYNPSSWSEVFWQAVWIGGRQRKFGFLGQLLALIRATYPFSLVIGIFKAIKYQELFFIKFKFIYDLGILSGILNKMVNHPSPRKARLRMD